MRAAVALIALSLFPAWPTSADNWPQYRGPQRNDVSAEKGLAAEWPAGGPPLVWTYADAGIGYSGPAVVDDRLYTIGGRGDTEFLIALDLAVVRENTVSQVWAARVGPKFDFRGNNWSAGPSATPTVDGELIFALGGMGDLVCVDTEGKERWRRNLPQELEAQVNPIGGGPPNLGWGFAWSPLVNGDQLVCVPGGPRGTLAALDKRTGEVLWRSLEVTDQAAYTSPMLAEFGGVRQYVVLTNRGLWGVNARDGKLLWSYRRMPSYDSEVINSPLIHGELVYVTVGAGHGGCDLVRVTRDGNAFRADLVYSNQNLSNHHGNVVLVDGRVYGFAQGRGWVCQDLETGEIIWVERRALRAGALTYADGRLYCYGEDEGTAVLIEAGPGRWKERGRLTIPKQSELRKPSGRIWTPPVVSGGRLFLRDQELLYCFDVAAR